MEHAVPTVFMGLTTGLQDTGVICWHINRNDNCVTSLYNLRIYIYNIQQTNTQYI